MPQTGGYLQNLNSTALDWPTLHARNAAWWAAHPQEREGARFERVPEYSCAFPKCRNKAYGHWCDAHRHVYAILQASTR